MNHGLVIQSIVATRMHFTADKKVMHIPTILGQFPDVHLCPCTDHATHQVPPLNICATSDRLAVESSSLPYLAILPPQHPRLSLEQPDRASGMPLYWLCAASWGGQQQPLNSCCLSVPWPQSMHLLWRLQQAFTGFATLQISMPLCINRMNLLCILDFLMNYLQSILDYL